MLTNAPVTPTIPVTDMQRAREFYENTLGLRANKQAEMPDGVLYNTGNGTTLYLYQRGPSKADHTLASFTVDDIEKEVDDLSQKGLTFEQYDMPNGIKTDAKGIAVMGDIKSAWFKDPDGNILALVQM